MTIHFKIATTADETHKVGDPYIYDDDGFICSWDSSAIDKVERRYSEHDKPKLNPRTYLTVPEWLIHDLIQLAYKAGQRKQKEDTQKTLQDIFGIKP